MKLYRNLTSLFAVASLSAFMAHGAVDQSGEKAMPTDNSRAYFAMSNGTTETLGETMMLSRTSAHFSLLKGTMKLRYSGERKGDSGSDDSEFRGDVYQVLNADEFFSLNKGNNGFCDKPVRWITIKSLSDSIGERSIRIGMLNIDDWHKFNANSPDACSADTFTLE
ncbi:hypothetical protein AWY96_00090 [Serratia plymuthica]|uniref:hypothetical protein n=2 Tax=Serratia TaxID=613 RepID=UPI00079FE559|nr:hypothetical protein [Serratia plymuthica]KYQ96981.1 hypothetical protein AWY96_00090 [Serratia plymuthica]